ncbi:MAG: response regulator [Bacteroidota bacterium]
MLSILHIEDDTIEALKLERILKDMDGGHRLVNAKHGEEALSIIREQAHPNLILLDLNMPKMSGFEFLQILKNDQYLHHIPVVILTTSRNREDVIRCYQIGIAGYIMKPLKYADYKQTIQKVVDYWNSNEYVAN